MKVFSLSPLWSQVRDVLQDSPGKMEEFLSLLFDFEQGAEGSRSAVELFSQLKPLLKDFPVLLKDFAAFLLPAQALECGLVTLDSQRLLILLTQRV